MLGVVDGWPVALKPCSHRDSRPTRKWMCFTTIDLSVHQYVAYSDPEYWGQAHSMFETESKLRHWLVFEIWLIIHAKSFTGHAHNKVRRGNCVHDFVGKLHGC